MTQIPALKAPTGMTWKEYRKHETEGGKRQKLEIGAKVRYGAQTGTVTEVKKEKTSVGIKTFVYVKLDNGRQDRFREDTTNYTLI